MATLVHLQDGCSRLHPRKKVSRKGRVFRGYVPSGDPKGATWQSAATETMRLWSVCDHRAACECLCRQTGAQTCLESLICRRSADFAGPPSGGAAARLAQAAFR